MCVVTTEYSVHSHSQSELEQKLNWKSELRIKSELDPCLLCKAMSTMVNVVFYYLNTTEVSAINMLHVLLRVPDPYCAEIFPVSSGVFLYSIIGLLC